jgi:xanthine/CO dehydrogenase XdhC/CoxF family maturation factor
LEHTIAQNKYPGLLNAGLTAVNSLLLMKEIKDIIRAFEEAQLQGRQTALATVVHVEGSSYRRPGARMLVTDDGQLTGAISGGCLEGDALRKALLVMHEKKPMLVTYDTMDEDDAKFGVGLGCNGIIQVLIEPVDTTNPNNPVELLKIVAGQRRVAVIVTLFSLENRKEKQLGTCFVTDEDNHINGHIPILKEELLDATRETLMIRQSSFKKYDHETNPVTAFIELIRPAVSLVIAGAGNDAIPLVEMAHMLGWETIVADGRANYIKPERFPKAHKLIVAKPAAILEQLVIDEQTVFVLVTHNYNYDMALLKELLQKQVVYVGMLGPKKKLLRMLDELKEEGFELNEKQLSVIHSPVGLDIGAETAEEIALAILAEIKAVMAGKQGQFLKGNAEAIHSRKLTHVEEKKQS